MGSSKQKKAFGLAEIIVALGIFGTAMIATVAVAIGSLRTVKDNELADSANSIMIRSIEYMKSPAVVEILNNLQPGGDVHSFRIKNDLEAGNPDQTLIVEEVTNTFGANVITDCSESGNNSRYRIIVIDNPGFLVCNQIILTQVGNSSFEIRSRVMYRTSKGIRKSELLGFRNTTGGG